MYLGDVTTIPSNLAGIPGVSVPIGLDPQEGLPVGLQVLAPAREDKRMYAAAAAVSNVVEANLPEFCPAKTWKEDK